MDVLLVFLQKTIGCYFQIFIKNGQDFKKFQFKL